MEKVPLSTADYERFHKNASAALARRGAASQIEDSIDALQRILFGALPIVGLLRWGWSPEAMLIFLLAGLWVGIVCDAAKYFFLAEQAEAFAAARYDDWHVWTVAQAIRSGDRAAYPSHLAARWQSVAGVLIDFVVGGGATILIAIMLVRGAGVTWNNVAAPGAFVGFAATTLLRLGATVGEMVRHRPHSGSTASPLTSDDRAVGERPVKVAVGLRGVGLFLLLFPLAALTDAKAFADSAPRYLMLLVNGLIVLTGVVNLFGPLLLRGETRWLREYLARRNPGESN